MNQKEHLSAVHIYLLMILDQFLEKQSTTYVFLFFLYAQTLEVAKGADLPGDRRPKCCLSCRA
jgi:hypothetical protein